MQKFKLLNKKSRGMVDSNLSVKFCADPFNGFS